MRQVYSPANSAEAHMLAHLLEQAGIAAHIHGEALQGGVGELPASGLLQLLTADEDYPTARRLILEWERVQSAPSQSDGGARTARAYPFWLLAIALLIGVASGWALKSRVAGTILPQEVTFDDNGDGAADGRFYYRSGAGYPYKLEDDENFDGAIDLRVFYNALGAASHEERDQDFDGFFETRTEYENGSVARVEIDSDENGVADIVSLYRTGALRRTQYLDSASGRVARVDYYNDFRVTRSDHDLDRDGFAETIRSYDSFGELTRTDTRRPGASP